jgi:hypothetical protein
MTSKRGVKKSHPPPPGDDLRPSPLQLLRATRERAAQIAILTFDAFRGAASKLIPHVPALTGILEMTPTQELAIATFISNG